MGAHCRVDPSGKQTVNERCLGPKGQYRAGQLKKESSKYSIGCQATNKPKLLKYCSFFIAAAKKYLKVLISSSDMEESLKTDVLEICTNACEKYVNDNQSVSIK